MKGTKNPVNEISEEDVNVFIDTLRRRIIKMPIIIIRRLET
jgi:hypothetical protein